MSSAGTLSIVATPIGNFDDLSPRAAIVLREADLVVCEEWKEGRQLLRQLSLLEKDLAQLNEHNEIEGTETILAALEEGRNVALVSDCGTPLLADPGRRLVEAAAARDIRIVPIPGVSSFVTALMVAGFPIEQFVFRGMLAAKTEERKNQLRALREERRTVILFDAPYRLERLVDELAGVFADQRQAVLAMDLTTPEETILRGTCAELARKTNGKHWKREFVIILGPAFSSEHFVRTRVR